MLEYSRNLKQAARELRKNMTDAEHLLWSRLRRKQLLGVPFYRQKPIGPYIVDFYAPAANLVIELDGSQHSEAEHLKRDAERDQCLSEMGLQIMRFDNLQVLQETDAVVEKIAGVIQERLGNPPCPPLPKGGAKEPEPVMISALEHFSYCPRQCGLIHLEQIFDENIYTLRGHDLHRHADEAGGASQGAVRVERALPIWSERLGLVGKADVVEFHDDIPYPVEYKSGRHRAGRHETLQLCAQALCLEEMFGVKVEKGALYWHGSRERREVVFTDALRRQVAEAAEAVRQMLESRIVPSPVNDKRCDKCSLNESCLPRAVAEKGRVRRAVQKLFTVEEGI